MKIFITGGTGFIGSTLVRQLVQQGHQVTCLVRSSWKAEGLQAMGVEVAWGDITDRASMREPMAGADLVFHLAAWYEVGLPPGAGPLMETINVGGTENVLGLAVELGIPRIVYTSTIGVYGDTYGRVVDETYPRACPFLSHYDRTKFLAHQVAQRYIEQGAPVIIVLPGSVYGPGDPSQLGRLIRMVLRRQLPVLLGADSTFTFVHVDDVARGHWLAAERGRLGESYILAGDVMSLGDFVRLVARLGRVPPPPLILGSRPAIPLYLTARLIERVLPLPPLFASESLRSLTGVTLMVTSAKAERELGYTHRPLEEGLAETVAWELAHQSGPPITWPTRHQVAGGLILAAAGLLLTWLLSRRFRR